MASSSRRHPHSKPLDRISPPPSQITRQPEAAWEEEEGESERMVAIRTARLGTPSSGRDSAEDSAITHTRIRWRMVRKLGVQHRSSATTVPKKLLLCQLAGSHAGGGRLLLPGEGAISGYLGLTTTQCNDRERTNEGRRMEPYGSQQQQQTNRRKSERKNQQQKRSRRSHVFSHSRIPHSFLWESQR